MAIPHIAASLRTAAIAVSQKITADSQVSTSPKEVATTTTKLCITVTAIQLRRFYDKREPEGGSKDYSTSGSAYGTEEGGINDSGFTIHEEAGTAEDPEYDSDDSYSSQGPEGQEDFENFSYFQDNLPGESTRHRRDSEPGGGGISYGNPINSCEPEGGGGNELLHEPEGGGVGYSRTLSVHEPGGGSGSDDSLWESGSVGTSQKLQL
jgi:hypothetical protein